MSRGSTADGPPTRAGHFCAERVRSGAAHPRAVRPPAQALGPRRARAPADAWAAQR